MRERMDGKDLIERSTRKAERAGGNGWGERHARAMRNVGSQEGQEQGVVQMLRGWADYADAHFHRFESPIGEDYVLGPAWLDIGKGIRSLLNGETGRLDCGTIDGLILEIAEHNGFEEDKL
jgi:hypothetical protein